jgi:uncharacterized protein
MAISFGGEFTVRRRRQEVYDFLTDPQRFAPLLPDFQGLSVQDATHFTVQVKVGVSHIRGTAEVKMHLAESDSPQHALYQGIGSMAGGNVNLTAAFDLDEAGEGTKVRWKGEAQIFGRLASMAGGILEPLGRKNVQKLIDGLQSALMKSETSGSGSQDGD